MNQMPIARSHGAGAMATAVPVAWRTHDDSRRTPFFRCGDAAPNEKTENPAINPMQPEILANAPRCGARARTRGGAPCRSPAVRGSRRCRMHGGKGSGAPRGNRNAFKHGAFTARIKDIARYLLITSMVVKHANRSASSARFVPSPSLLRRQESMSPASPMASEKETDMDPSLRWDDDKATEQPPLSIWAINPMHPENRRSPVAGRRVPRTRLRASGGRSQLPDGSRSFGTVRRQRDLGSRPGWRSEPVERNPSRRTSRSA